MPDLYRSFDGRLPVTPPVGDEQLAGVPAKRGVLLLAGAGEQPIVLLTAADIRGRLHSRLAQPAQDVRKKTVDLREITAGVAWKLSYSPFETDWRYLQLARELFPDRYPELLAWKPTWFVHVDPQEEFPQFVRTREVLERPGQYVGPFQDGRSAERFIETLQDAFDLCRHHRCLRQAPHGQPCAYAQIGRCLSVCDGSTSLEEYRRVLARAAGFAAGDRQAALDDLTARMKAAAAEMKFEQAGVIKGKLQRLAELDKPAYEHVASIEAFRYVLVQSGPNPQTARAFLVVGGAIAECDLRYPPDAAELETLAARMGQEPRLCDAPDAMVRLTIGLVSSYLYCGRERKGLILRWRAGMGAGELAAGIESAAQELNLRAPRRRSKQGKPPDPSGGADRSPALGGDAPS